MIRMLETEEHRIARLLSLPPENVCTVGSKLICGSGNDHDFLVLIRGDKALHDAGFAPDLAEQNYPGNFSSWRKGNDNVIATEDRGFFLAEYATATAAKVIARNTLFDGEPPFDFDRRADRVAFHALVREAVEDRLGARLPEQQEISTGDLLGD